MKFAEFELDRGRYELRRGDCVLKLEKIPMELLVLLVESNGQLVTRDEMVEKIWGKDVFLDTEHGINTAIRKIRQTLGDDPENPRFVQTVTGKGYRFIATTNTMPARANGNVGTPASALEDARQVETQPSESGSGIRAIAGVAPATGPKPRLGLAFQLTGLMLLASVGIVAVVFGLNVRGVRDRLFSPSPRPRIHSLAVLPLENLSADPAQEYFADGMTDELITMLAKNAELRVVSRTSAMQYKKVHRPLREIAQELGVDGILEGSVGRSGSRVHMTAQLIHAPTDTHVWAESFERDLSDVGTLQSELAVAIAKQVGAATSVPEKTERKIKPDAHDAYLLGRYHWFAYDYDGSGQYFQKAIDLQPDYAAAWSGLADSYAATVAMGWTPPKALMPQAEAAARKALELDDSVAEAHNSMAAVYLFYRWDWEAAERESSRGIELNPNLGEAHHFHSLVLTALNRMDQTLQEERKAAELDPVTRPWALGWALIKAHQFDAAVNELRLRSETQPADGFVSSLLRDAYFYKGMEKEAEQEWERGLRLTGAQKLADEMHQVYGRGGFQAVLGWRLSRRKLSAAKDFVSALEFAEVYARLKRKEDTIRYLERAYEERAPFMAHVQSNPDFDFLHSDPRYRAIIKKMGLPPAY